MPGKLTTHVLDTAAGIPASNVPYRLYRFTKGFSSNRILQSEGRTNADGRSDSPVLAGEAFIPGAYCLEFDVGLYLASQQQPRDSAPFLELIPINFAITDGDSHYHVPLLLSPYGYTTYRGS